MSAADGQLCRNCKFWAFEDQFEYLPSRSSVDVTMVPDDMRVQCRRMPITTVSVPDGWMDGWPMSHCTDWCGEWQPIGDKRAGIYADKLEEKGCPAEFVKILRGFDGAAG